jgi:hypothetical protein
VVDGRVKKEGEGMCVNRIEVLHTHYENQIIKPLKTVQSWGMGGESVRERVNLIKVHFM